MEYHKCMSRESEFEERLLKFSKEIIFFCKKVPENNITRPIISQLVRSATSVGANYIEANSSFSPKDFASKISICRKEAQETKYWLRLMNDCNATRKTEIDLLWKEANELSLIFNKIAFTINQNKKITK